MKKRPYKWDDDLGVYRVGKNGHRYQEIQLLWGPATKAFRRKCGKKLAKSLNTATRTTKHA